MLLHTIRSQLLFIVYNICTWYPPLVPLLQPLPLPGLVPLYPDHLERDLRVLLGPGAQEILNHSPSSLSQRMLGPPLLQELRNLV